MAKKASALEEQESIAFQYHENLNAIVRDLKKIREMCPGESSRSGYGFVKDRVDGLDLEKMLLIEARKNDFIGYIQTICEDHLAFSNELLGLGWTPELQRKSKVARRGKKKKG